MSPIGISNREQLGYSAETTWGTTVGASPMKIVRFVSHSAKTNTQSVRSAEIQNSGEISDHIRTSVRGESTVNIEWSYGAFDDIIEALLGGTWATNVVKFGTVKRSFTFERQFLDLTLFQQFKGSVITGLSLNCQAGRVIDGTFSWVSKGETIPSGTTAGTGTTAAPTNVVFNPIDSVQLVQEGGSGSVAGVMGFTINIQRPVIDAGQIASADPADLNAGGLEVSGTIDVYFQDATYLTKYLNWTTTSLAFTVGGVSNLKYAFLLNKVKLSQADNPNQGMNQNMMVRLNWNAFKDATTSTLQITRTP